MIICSLFQRSVAKVVRGVVALSFGTSSIPSSYDSFWPWIKQSLARGDHVFMLGLSAICWAIWRTRNAVIFEKKFIKHPCEIICSACAFMRFWAGLYPESMKEIIMAGADSMLKTALRILGSQRERVLLDDQEQEPFKHLLIR